MDLGLHQKTAVVTGGSGGIGSAICRTLAREGAHVAVGYFRNGEAAQEVVRTIELEGGTAVPLQVDVRDRKSVEDLFSRNQIALGGLDVLVNCAGVAFFHPITDYPEGDWDDIIDTNLKGAFLCSKAAMPYLLQRGGGDVVNVSSLAAVTGSFEGSAYAASKAGINILTLSLALELASANIRVNAVAPGRIATAFRRTQAGPYYEFMLEQTPQRRMGTVQEVANAVVFMASRVSAFITGETLYVTGGLHTVYLHHVMLDPDSKLRREGTTE
jgi:NAD(P)-dependent dehydrogenase (short-subunit alcohol dehydrogenase family)